MNPATHEKYFARLDVNTDASVDWFSPTGAEVCVHAANVGEGALGEVLP